MEKVIDFIRYEIWRVRVSDLPSWRAFAVRHLRMFVLALRGFKEDKCQLRAAALTFFSLLSIVPVVAMAFGIAKGFGFEKRLEVVIMENLKGQEEAAARILEFANQLLANTQGGVIAGIGVAILFWTVIKVLGNIEQSFNDIWGVKRGRTLARKFGDYLAIMLICPLLFILSSSATVLVAKVIKLGIAGVLPFLITYLLFSFIYIIIPNTKVNIRSGVIGAIVAGTIYQFVQWIYITFQVGVTKFGAIYGSFAALPLFLIWLQMSWLILLFGTEVAFAYQNDEFYEFEPDCAKASFALKRLMLLYVLTHIIKGFIDGNKPKQADALSHELGMPIRLVRDVLFMMTECGLISEIFNEGGRSKAYQPSEHIDHYTISYVLAKVGYQGVSDIPVAQTDVFAELKKSLGNIHKSIETSEGNVCLKDL